MFRRYRIGTATVALALMGLGGLLLAANLGARPAWQSILDWWPVILIALGLEIVIRFAVSHPESPGPRWDGASLFLIIVLVTVLAAGNIAAATPGLPDMLSVAFNSQSEAVARSTVALPLTPGGTLTINNPVGSVQVLPAGEQEARVEAVIHARGASAEKAEALADSVTIGVSGVVSTTVDIGRPPSTRYQSVTVDVTLYVPDDVELNIVQNTGVTELQALTANVRIDREIGSLDIRGLQGRLEVQQRAGRIEARDVVGDVLVNGQTIDAEFDSVTGDVEITTENGQVTLGRVSGNVSMRVDSGRASISQVSGNVDIAATNTAVDASEITGRVQLRTDHALVRLSARGLKNDVEIFNDFGTIELDLPDSAYRLDLESTSGSISVQPDSLEVAREGTREALQANVGTTGSPDAFPLVRAYTSHDNILVKLH